MSQHGLEVIDTTVQKTHEWINAISETMHLGKADAYKALRSVLHTLRDRMVVEHAAHFASQLPMLLRGLFYEGWEPGRVPIKMSLDQFLKEIGVNIISERHVDPIRIATDVLAVMSQFLSPGELEKIKQGLPKEFWHLFPAS